MNKKILVLLVTCLGIIHASAQTLFTYGNNAADAKEFLKAYNKNNTSPVANKAKAINDYLELYINSRLKVREAYDRKLDTLSQIKMEVENLRAQISENYMTDPEMLNHLLDEAFKRSQKDIQVAHIFISLRDAAGMIDSVSANAKKENILQRLKKGEDFLQVAQQFSDDPAAKTTKGDIGYITVFTLPYNFENAIYATPVGKYSNVVVSKSGYHIFKVLAERKALGKIKAQQILIANPPDAPDAIKKKNAQLADSLYKRILAGDNFNHLALAFSNDYMTGVTGGNMPDIGVGQYDPGFEKMLWSLPKDGAVTKPFQTSHGWHIIKRLSVRPIVTDPNNKTYRQELQAKIMTDSRLKASNEYIYKKVIDKAGLKKFSYNEEAMWLMADSVLDLKSMKELGRTIFATTPMFSIGETVYTATEFVNYANAYRFKQDGTGAKPHPQVRDEFLDASLYNYYRNHLEDFNEEFRSQMNEFKDGNLFFEIMQQEIWNKAQSDTVALHTLYEKNKKKYFWDKSVDAVFFFCSDETTAKAIYEQVKKNPSDWRNIAGAYTEKVVTDSSRYEWSQVPNLFKMIPRAGMVLPPLVNANDNTASFAYIVQSYSSPMQRSYEEAKGLVINDYQDLLEKQWNEALKKKYPVVIDQKVLAEISK